jgi:Tol biopolymer transport system component
MKKRKSLITAGVVVSFIYLLSSISSAVIYDHKNIKIQQVALKGDNFDPEWSPDGSKIVYASTESDPDSCIWVVDPDGNNRRMISYPKPDEDYYEPTWSPDGSHIAFISRYSDGSYIYVMGSDGSDVKKLTPSLIRELDDLTNLKWSPDGLKITYDSRLSGQFSIWVMDSDGTNRTKLTTVDDAYNSVWSPDGSKIAYEYSNEIEKGIWIMDPDGNNKTRLKPEKNRTDTYFQPTWKYFQPTWSPDGSKIAFVIDRFSRGREDFSIAVLNLDDNSVTSLTEARKRPTLYKGRVREAVLGDEFYPEWSPDGLKILFMTEDGEIWLMNSDGSNMIPLTEIKYSGEVFFNPKWSPDGSKILFERKYLGSRDIFVMSLGEAIIPATTPESMIDVSTTPKTTQTVTSGPMQFTSTSAAPSPTLTPTHSPTTTPVLTPAPTVTPTEFPTPEEGVPAFEAIFVIAVLLTVTYLLRRRK